MPVNPYDKYKQNSISSASKEELTLMLYDGAVKFCNQAIAAIESKNYIEANRLIKRVQDIVGEFRVTLNKKYEISQSLDSMYEYIFRLLIDANISKDAEILKEARDLLRDLRDTWKEAMVLAKTKPR